MHFQVSWTYRYFCSTLWQSLLSVCYPLIGNNRFFVLFVKRMKDNDIFHLLLLSFHYTEENACKTNPKQQKTNNIHWTQTDEHISLIIQWIKRKFVIELYALLLFKLLTSPLPPSLSLLWVYIYTNDVSILRRLNVAQKLIDIQLRILDSFKKIKSYCWYKASFAWMHLCVCVCLLCIVYVQLCVCAAYKCIFSELMPAYNFNCHFSLQFHR